MITHVVLKWPVGITCCNEKDARDHAERLTRDCVTDEFAVLKVEAVYRVKRPVAVETVVEIER